MIADLPYRGREVAVLGLGKSGRVAAHALARSGAEVLAWDDSPSARDRAAAEGLPIVDLAAADASAWAALVISPGIPLTHPAPHPVAARALDAKVPVIGDIELLWQAGTGARFVGITGTNGKSTTTALVFHTLASAGREAAVGGNLGIPVLDLRRLGRDGVYVIEMSSFQLDLVDDTHFTIAALLNVTPDHLDRHGDMAGYVAAKRRIFRHQTAEDTVVIGLDDAYGRDLAGELERAPARVIGISGARMVPGGVGVADGALIDDLDGGAAEIADLRPIPTLPGAHNWQNAAAAYAICRAAGLTAEEIVPALATYPGLPHRQERVGALPGILFVNDSKATNADAAAKALGCYPRIYWIAGGVPKEGGIAPLTPWFDRIVHAYLIGTAAEDFAQTLAGRVPATCSGDLATALVQATDAARADASGACVVLLSPACASYDQFANFEARGDAFRKLVQDMIAEAA